jgi:menaquinol-cytochrome c reductase iron-sulfur subunit
MPTYSPRDIPPHAADFSDKPNEPTHPTKFWRGHMDSASPDSTPIESPAERADATTAFEPPRRGFFVKFLAGALGIIVGAVPFVTGLLFFLDPLIRDGKATPKGQEGNNPEGVEKDEDGFVNLNVTIDALPADGTPQSVKVHDDKVDAWNKFLNVEVGTVWLLRNKDGVTAFNTVCPHLGCSVDYRQWKSDFYCPCHQSTFDLNGDKLNPTPPRSMDQLEVKVKDGKNVWLKFQNFRGATSEKIAIS